MNNFTTFLGKELLEAWRKKRILVMFAVFLFITLVSPTLTRYSNEILQMLVTPEEMNAMGIILFAPHWSSSYYSFYGNMNQIGMIALILLCMGLVVQEIRRGTAALMMVKGLGQARFIIVKFVAYSITLFTTLLIMLILQHFLTLAFFGAGAEFANLLTGFVLYWIFAMMILSLAILASAISTSVGMAAVFGILGFIAFSIPASLPRLREAFPYTLSTRVREITSYNYFSDMLWANILTAILTTAIFLTASILILRKREL